MVKQSELEVMVCDLFVDAYRAGQSCGDLAYNAARGTRASLIRKLGEVYAELESESYHREQFEVELQKANNELANLRDHVSNLEEELERRIEEKKAIFNGTPPTLGMKLRLSNIYGSKLTDPEEVPDHHDAFDAMFPGCTPDDLPFPDVAVAGHRPATTEASADAEGEAAPASEVLGGDE